jgi:tetratricopeptide (TPR) repeat protein
MVRIPAILLVLALPAVSFAGASGGLVPVGHLSNAIALIEANRAPEAMKILDAIRPDFTTLGAYHYVSGRVFAASRNPLLAASHYRHAAIYATGTELKEISLFLAAETELGMGYRFEAKMDCLLFLKKFPNSALIPKVRLLLARSIAEVGRFREAIRQFELAGNTPEALYGKANSLQRMGMTREATQAYAAAAAVDARFPDSSEETRCWLGENLRLSGDTARAKGLLLTVTGERLRELASIGLGEIAGAESQFDEAIGRYKTALSSKDRKVRRLALLRLADAETAAGRSREAAARLEEIIAKHPFTREADEAVLRNSRIRAKAGDETGALSLLTKLVRRVSPLRREALDGIEAILLSARGKDAARFAALWNAGGRWLMDASREAVLVTIAEDLKGTGKPYVEVVRWLSRNGSRAVRAEYLVAFAWHCTEVGDAGGIRECLRNLKAMNVPGDDVLRVEAGLKFSEKDYRGASDTLLSLRKIEGRDAAMLGETLPYAGDPRRATAVLEAAVSRNGAGPRELTRLADALYDAGRRPDALKYYRKAVEKDSANEWATYRLAALLGMDGGEEYLKRIKADPMLARMAKAARKEMALNAR